MKRFSFVLAMLAVALVFGLALVSCGPSVDPPVIANLRTYERVDDTDVNKDAFTVGAGVMFKVDLTAGSNDLTTMYFPIKKDGVEVWNAPPFPLSTPVASGTNRSYAFGTFTATSAGTYILEAYAEDAEGNKSKTLTHTFTVQ